ncbi:MAG: isoamylase early set domain-containing protein [Chloroflexota bacterium]|jgi:1,4-alpha-glucan branching enzyme
MLKKKYFKTKDECEVTFELESAEAESVALVSEANDWEPVKMTKRRKDGVYYTKVRLPNDSQFQFRYLVDGQSWVNDSAADDYVANEFGGKNSVVITSAS